MISIYFPFLNNNIHRYVVRTAVQDAFELTFVQTICTTRITSTAVMDERIRTQSR